MSRLSQRRFYGLLFLVLCLALGVLTQVLSTHSQPSGSARRGPVQVTGTLMLGVGSGNEGTAAAVSPDRQIELPDIDVFLRNAISGTNGSKLKTQLDGRFYLTAPSPGTYTVCWDAPGIGTGCGNRFNVSADAVSAKIVRVSAKGGFVYGKVLTADNRPCWVNDSFFALDVSTLVTLFKSTQSPAQPAVRANTQGEYVFAGLNPDRYRVRAACEKSRGEATASIGGGGAVLANITLPNHAPNIGGIAAFDNAKGITRAALSTSINVQAVARDVENDSIDYLWKPADDTAPTVAVTAAQKLWTTGPRPGLQTLYLMARDGKGGYSFKRFDIPVGGADLTFSGRVIDETTSNPIGKAEVNVNGSSTTSNDQGWFTVTTPPVASPERYVLNITHPKYALLSRVHDKASQGDVYQMIRTQSTSVDPSAVINVTDESSSGPCGGKSPARPLPGHGKRAATKTDQTGASTQNYPCRRAGVRLTLPAGVLVDANRRAASGLVTVQLATLNPARRSLPGDYRALDSSQNPVEMLSYGAVYAQFRDSSGNPLNLKSGTTAQIEVPIPAEQQASAKPSIPMWSYDESRGIWVEEGKATRKLTPQGPVYVGKTKHFSTLNMDVAGNDPAQATCVRYQLGASLSGWTNLVVRAYVSYGGTAVQVKETPLNTDQYHAIYRIPFAPPAPPPNTLRLELRGTYGGQEVVLLNNIINTDARPKMTGTDLWPPYPYSECGDVITLEADPVNLPYYGDIDATGRPAFLTGPFGQFAPANGEQVATDYYNTLDPGNATNPTLSLWWTNHGFAADGTGGTRAAYLNFNDLGFGRDMNCLKTGSDLACYVTNYGLPDQNPANADAAESKDLSKRGATVAMEFKNSESADRRVRFYVYGGGDPTTAGKLKFADLDGLGPKSVPNLCIVCHGGTYDSGSNNVLQARFREFDLQSFKYSGGRSWDYSGAANNSLTAGELTAFATLNQRVRDIQPGTSAIKELIDAWYPGGFGPGTKPVEFGGPPGWSTATNVYKNVFAKSCRTCHVARDSGNANAFLLFRSSSNYQGTDYVVCSSPKVMPNAYITYKNFWNDTQRVIDYKNFTGAATCQ
ncbi:MAG: hypothetical protein ABJC10_10715 [Acidobacteriota bacterium]